ncbi:MAG: hypothetical protein J5769_05515 [Bacteroidales bacterium]|nr:hypothetical protein [Bacteroidales bacterium]
MKKFLLAIAAASLLFCVSAFAQPRGGQNRDGDWRERVNAERKALIKEELRLQDSDPFWAVYDELQAQGEELMKARMEAKKALREAVKDNKPDKEIEPLLDAFLKAEAACISFKDTKRDRIRKVLTPSQFARLLLVEERFMNRQMDQRGPGGHGGPGQGRGNGHGHGGHGGGHGQFNRQQ